MKVEQDLFSIADEDSLDELEAQLALLEGIQASIQLTSKTPTLQPVPRDRELPLSFAQQRLWFIDQLEPGNIAYNVPIAVCVTGPLCQGVLEKSLNEIVQRHEVLRTTFYTNDGQPIQVIAPTLSLTIPLVDLEDLPEPKREAEARRLALAESDRPFDLVQGPLVRVTLLYLTYETYIVLFTMHHIVSDGWSMGILIRELMACYRALSAGEEVELPELPIQYADFAVWQREQLQGEMLERQLMYWKNHLSGGNFVLELPTDHVRPAIQSYAGAQQQFVIPEELNKALTNLSRQEGVTPFMILLAAFKVLLYRYTGQTDIVVGSPIANRHRTEIEGLIGFFVNTLVLRSHLSGNMSFRELLKQVRETTLGAYAHQDLPFEILVKEFQSKRDLSRSPLFQVMFGFENMLIRSITESSDLTLTPLEIDPGVARFDLMLLMTETEQGLNGLMEYNTDLFEAATIERMQGHFQKLLTAITKDPDRHLNKLLLLNETEQHQLLEDWNKTEVDYPSDRCIHQLFEDQVAQTPEAVAVVFEGQALTYRELNRQANQLAHHLRMLGVGPEVLVGIYLERSPEMIIGLLGILKAGGAYVPLDPMYPQERLAFMLNDAQVAILLTQKRLLKDLPPFTAQVICLDIHKKEFVASQNEDNLSPLMSSKNLAYMIYTSGSTGKPKGVQISHRAMVNFLESMSRRPGLTKEDILLAVTTLSFDIAGLELFLPLVVGAWVKLVSQEVATDGAQLSTQLAASGATVMQATPVTWRLLLESGWPGDNQLRILCGGETFPQELANQLVEKAKIVWNMYGPTETTIWSSIQQVQTGDKPITIGRPIANTQFYVLDEYFTPTPVGVPGELYIGGDGLARGYLNRPELTAARFIPNPFSQDPGVRLYRTGDLARYLSDGVIEFLGRIDHQIKIRGFRIELGEIEAVLSQHPAIQESIVVARETNQASWEKHLVAYIVSNQKQRPTLLELRHFLKEKLPEYMIPSTFILLDALPLTHNGKVNRRVLPEPDQTALRPSSESTFAKPRTPIEKKLADLWIELLNIKEVSIYDNFFDLGGHSLLAARLISRIHQTFRVQLPLRVLFEATTIADLSLAIAEKQFECLDKEKMARLMAEISQLPKNEAKPG